MSTELRAAADALNEYVTEYTQGYELYGEDEQGREGAYMPTERERWLIEDAIEGLLADTDFVAKFNAWQDLVRAGSTEAVNQEKTIADAFRLSIMTPDQQLEVERGVCPKCNTKTLDDRFSAENIIYVQCSQCLSVYVQPGE